MMDKSKKICLKPIKEEVVNSYKDQVKAHYKCNDHDASYFVFTGRIENTAYDLQDQNIHILKNNGKITDITKTTDHFNLKALARTVTKYYMCYPALSAH